MGHSALVQWDGVNRRWKTSKPVCGREVEREQISLLLENSSLQEKLSSQGLNFVRKNYSWEKHGKQLEEILCS